MLSFSIIIVSWNALRHLQNFLPTVAEADYPDFEIILSDNASTDQSVQWVKQHYPTVKVVKLDKNYGYCGGNNKAVPYASGEIIIFLNNDVRVNANWLHPINETFSEDETIAAVQPKLLAHIDPLSFEYAGAAGGFIDKHGFPFCRGRLFDTVEKDMGQYDEDVNLFWASGAALAIRKKVFEEMGGFDEDFEFHMEEIDLCWRLLNAGYKVRSCTKSVVFHLGGGSLPQTSPRKTYYNYRNSLVMLWKNFSKPTLFTRFAVRIYFDFMAALRELLSGKTKHFNAILGGHLDFWKSFSKTNQKRKKLQAMRKVTRDPDEMYKKDIIAAYFFKGKKRYSDLKKQ